MMRDVTWVEIGYEAGQIADRWRGGDIEAVYPIPRGGCVPGALVALYLGVPLVEEPFTDDRTRVLVVDDLIDSGETWERLRRPVLFDAMFRKPHSPTIATAAREIDDWLVFPWERGTDEQIGPTDAVTRLLESIGEDPTREGLTDTPKRVVRALAEMTDGRSIDVAELLTRSFPADGYSGMVIVRHVDFVSLCEHHLLTFTGTATVAYIPGDHGRVVGLSKLARLVDVYARRLQIQERMTEQIADAIVEHLNPEGVGVVITARHSCLACRGARKPNAEMITSSLRGVLLDKPAARAEFMGLALGGAALPA